MDASPLGLANIVLSAQILDLVILDIPAGMILALCHNRHNKGSISVGAIGVSS